MNKSIFSRFRTAVTAALAAVGSFISSVMAPPPGSVTTFMPVGRMRKQGGYVLLGKSYMGYPAGSIVELPQSTELAMIANGQAQLSAGPPTTGPVTTNASSGALGIAAGQASVVVTNPAVTVQSIIYAIIAQAAADATALRVERVVASAGFFTVYVTAAATATTIVDWAILNPNGSLSAPI